MANDEDRKEPGWLSKPFNLRRLEEIQGPSWKKPKNDVESSRRRDDKVEVGDVISSLSPLPLPATEEGHHVNDWSLLTYNAKGSSGFVPVLSYKLISQEEWDNMMITVINLKKKVFSLEDKLAHQANSVIAEHEIVESTGYPVMRASVASSSSLAAAVIGNPEVSSLQNITSTANIDDIAVQEASSNEGTAFSCPDCNMAFTVWSQLKLHISVHRNRKIHCDQCGLKFASKDYLARHMKAHHK